MDSDIVEEKENLIKNNVKNEILTKINDILIENNVPEIDHLTFLNLNNQVAYLGNIAIFDYDILETVENQLSEILNNYGTYSIISRNVISCCKPVYKNISFKVNVTI